MGQKCQICCHPMKYQIEKDVMAGLSYQKIGIKYEVGWQSVRGHWISHQNKRMVAAVKKQEMIQDLNMMQEFTALMADIKEQIQKFKDKGKDALSIKATDTLIRLYSTMAQFASVFYQSQVDQNKDEHDEQTALENEEFAESLKILTLDELRIYKQLVDKLLKQDKGIKIALPIDIFSPEIKRTRFKSNGSPDHAEEQALFPDLSVREVKAKEIPS